MRRAFSILAVVLSLLLLTAPAALAKPNECNIICYHIVQPGETIFCIARAYGVDPWAIAAQNGIVNPNVIHPGAGHPRCVRLGAARSNVCTSVPALAWLSLHLRHLPHRCQWRESVSHLAELRREHVAHSRVQQHLRPELHPRRRCAVHPGRPLARGKHHSCNTRPRFWAVAGYLPHAHRESEGSGGQRDSRQPAKADY